MKVLCPIDFSTTSINACYWIADLLAQLDEAELHLCHFIQYNRRATMFLSIDDIFIERAKKDMAELTDELSKRCKTLNVNVTIFKSHAKEGIVDIAKRKGFDLIVTGTSGLNALKNMTVGSVTKYIFDHSTVPVLAVPVDATWHDRPKIALALDSKPLAKTAPILFLKDFIDSTNASLQIAQIPDEEGSPIGYDRAVDTIYKGIDIKHVQLDLKGTLAETLSNYSADQNIDLLCMIHHPKGWLKRLFSKSTTTSELFSLRKPLLVLRD